MKSKTCCFTGHRNLSESDILDIQQQLYIIIESLIKKGVIYYGCGGAIGFDTMAAETVLELKKIYPQVKLIMVLPCHDQDKYWSTKDKEKYVYINNQADKIVYTSKEYTSDCMLKRNRHLVDNSSYCICYLRNNTGGTAYTVSYAKSKKLNIIQI